MAAAQFAFVLTALLLAAKLSAEAPGLSGDPVVIEYADQVVTRAQVDGRFQVAVRLLAHRQGIVLAEQDPAALALLRNQYLDKYARNLVFLRASADRRLIVSEAQVELAFDELLAGTDANEFGDAALLRSVVRDELTLELLTETMLREIEIPAGDVITMHHDVKDSLATPEEFCVRHVQVDSVATAAEVRVKLEQGADFAEIAANYSTDATSAGKAGDIGCFERVYSGPRTAFENAVFAAEEGLLVGPVESELGQHMLVVYKHLMPRAPTLAEAYAEIERELALEQLPSRLQMLVTDSGIDVYPDAFRVTTN